MNIVPGDYVKITLPDGWRCAGIVLSAHNCKDKSGVSNWYIELDAIAGGITGYTYWKQGTDGGTIEKYPDGEHPCTICLRPVSAQATRGHPEEHLCADCA
ncbi:MAG: hypothetical protein ACYS7Y_35930 [Planctomycetota bacterium]|jgi:hypothetical protein